MLGRSLGALWNRGVVALLASPILLRDVRGLRQNWGPPLEAKFLTICCSLFRKTRVFTTR